MSEPRSERNGESEAIPTDLPVVRVVGAAIVRGGRCLVAQRGAAMASPLLWELPGGKVEPDEDPRRALAREIREELALEVEVGAHLGRGSAAVDGRRIILDAYLARLIGGTLALAEHRAVRWLAAGELDTVSWCAPDVPLLPTLRAALYARPDRDRAPRRSRG